MNDSVELTPGAVARLTEALARFSGEGPGVTRLAYDAAWCEAHRWLAAQARERGLAATPDAAGNLLLHDAALKPGARVLLTGSHLDTVVHGGRFDGAYGALAGLLLAASLRGATRLPVVGLVTCEEEGSRFPGAFLGARALLGRVSAGEPESSRDAAGVSWHAALAEAGRRGCVAPGGLGRATSPFSPAAFLELHIEQGPVLESERLALGVVDRIAGYRRVRVALTGEARHAGTTPMRMRHDALAAGAEIVLACERVARLHGDPAVATAGAANAEPGLYNVVPGACEVRLDLRHVEPAALQRLAGEIELACREIATLREVGLALETVSRQDPIAMDAGFVAEAESLARERGLHFRRMASGAGHDAMIFAGAGVPSLMLFVPSRGGVSHSPDEFSAPEDLAGGIAFARDLLPRLAARIGTGGV